VRNTPYKWLDIAALVNHIIKPSSINRIRYFTARVTARPGDPTQPERQQAYLRALHTTPNLTVHYGRFLTSEVYMRLVTPLQDGTQTVRVTKTEEKGSDVNLATLLLLDAARGDFDQAIVVSNDSDLLLPVRVVRQELGKQVGVLCPHPKPSAPLIREATFFRPIRQGALAASQFPATLHDHAGAIVKPSSW
jgi:hypothetical protein